MTALIKQRGITIISLLLSLPAACFFVIALLKYAMGVDAPFDAMAPVRERLGIGGTLSWNFRLLILAGPAAVFLFWIFRVLTIRIQFTRNHLLFQLLVRKEWVPLLVAASFISILAVLLFFTRQF
jgi:hypothetical protein